MTFFPQRLPALSLWDFMAGPTAPLSLAASFLGSLGVGLIGVWLVLAIPSRLRTLVLLGATALLTLSQSGVFALYGYAWAPLPALLALAAGAATAGLLRPTLSIPQRLFAGRLSPAALSTLEKARDLSFLQPDQREACILTCRLLNENALRELLPAPDFLKLCDTFRTRASALLLAQGACLDPAESTGVRAFFGLPLAAAAPAHQAVRAALALDDAMQACFASLSPAPQEIPICGIGLTSGTLTAGVTGTGYTVLGDAVELSRWLAALNSTWQTRVLLDAATHLAADNVEARPLEFINPPEGAAVEIFQLLGTTGTLSRAALARRNAFRDAIMLLRAGHAADAARRFADARTDLPAADPVLDYFVSIALDQTQRDAASAGSPPPAAPPAATSGPAPRRIGRAGRKLPRRP